MAIQTTLNSGTSADLSPAQMLQVIYKFAIDLRLNIQIAFYDLQQKFQHAEYFTCDPLISQAILI